MGLERGPLYWHARQELRSTVEQLCRARCRSPRDGIDTVTQMRLLNDLRSRMVMALTGFLDANGTREEAEAITSEISRRS